MYRWFSGSKLFFVCTIYSVSHSLIVLYPTPFDTTFLSGNIFSSPFLNLSFFFVWSLILSTFRLPNHSGSFISLFLRTKHIDGSYSMFCSMSGISVSITGFPVKLSISSCLFFSHTIHPNFGRMALVMVSISIPTKPHNISIGVVVFVSRFLYMKSTFITCEGISSYS